MLWMKDLNLAVSDCHPGPAPSSRSNATSLGIVKIASNWTKFYNFLKMELLRTVIYIVSLQPAAQNLDDVYISHHRPDQTRRPDQYTSYYTVHGAALGFTNLAFTASSKTGQLVSSRVRDIQVFPLWGSLHVMWLWSLDRHSKWVSFQSSNWEDLKGKIVGHVLDILIHASDHDNSLITWHAMKQCDFSATFWFLPDS